MKGTPSIAWIRLPSPPSSGLKFSPDIENAFRGKLDQVLTRHFTAKANAPIASVERAQPDGAANGSQPIRSETNRTSGRLAPVADLCVSSYVFLSLPRHCI